MTATTKQREVVKRPDGDLTIEGTSVWMPGNLTDLDREIEWTLRRLSDLNAGRAYLAFNDLKQRMNPSQRKNYW